MRKSVLSAHVLASLPAGDGVQTKINPQPNPVWFNGQVQDAEPPPPVKERKLNRRMKRIIQSGR